MLDSVLFGLIAAGGACAVWDVAIMIYFFDIVEIFWCTETISYVDQIDLKRGDERMHGHFAVIFLTYGLDNIPIFQNILHSILSEDEAIDIANKWIDYVIKQHNEELLNSGCSNSLSWHPEYCCFGDMGATDGYVFMENHNCRINIGKVIIVMAEAYKPGSNDQFNIF